MPSCTSLLRHLPAVRLRNCLSMAGAAAPLFFRSAAWPLASFAPGEMLADCSAPPLDIGVERVRKLTLRPLPRCTLHSGTAVLAAPKGRRIAPTCTWVQVPPRAVLTLRSVSLPAIAL